MGLEENSPNKNCMVTRGT